MVISGVACHVIRVMCSVPQGSVLGLLLFILYMADLADIAAQYNLTSHAFDDDNQLYIHCKPERAFTLPNQMTSVFSESNSRRICHSTSMSTLLVLSAFFNHDNYAASDIFLIRTLSLHSFMRSSQAESIIAAVS